MHDHVERELVLVGGGHSHVQVIRAFGMNPVPGVRVTVVVDRPVAVYSGMVPGFVAGDYAARDLEIDVRPLARDAGMRVIVARVTRIDPERRRVHMQGRPPLRYDLLSVNIGSTVAVGDVPGVRDHALPTRPIGRFVRRVGDILDRAEGEVRVVVVGAGAGGVELAFALEARIRRQGGLPRVTLVEAGPRILPGGAMSAVRRVTAAAARRGVAIRTGAKVVRCAPDAVHLADGDVLPADLVVWVTGAVAHDVLRDSGLPVDDRGFVRVDRTLRVRGTSDIFAAGDCAVMDDHPDLPRAGVYAVRMGPVVAENLRSVLTERPLRPYHPQSDFLSLLNLGDGTAIGTKWGVSVEGAWVQRLKDRIDRRFMERFQVLTAEGRRTAAFPPMVGDDMRCAGCAAKVGPDVLAGSLRRAGLVADEDAARVSVGVDLAWTVDAFPACTDDPWLVARIATVHALADLWAKGVRPHSALAIVTVPDDAPSIVADTLDQVLAGVASALEPHGVALVGGHTTLGDELVVGLTALGPADGFLALSNARPGQQLLLTRPLGTGVALRADVQGAFPGRAMQSVLDAMQAPEDRVLAVRDRVAAATDVSGFGLANHLLDLCRAAGCGAEIDLDALPVLPGVEDALRNGVRSTAAPGNLAAAAPHLDGDLDHPRVPLLVDPQTGGGLLLCVPDAHVPAVAEATGAVVVGRLVAGPPRVRLVTLQP